MAGLRTAYLTATAGEYGNAGVAEHALTIHARGHIDASIALGGRTLRRRQRPGDIDLIPADTPVAIVDEGPNAVLVLGIPKGAVESRLAEFGLLPAPLEPRLSLRDEPLADLAWRIHGRRDARHGLYDECLAHELTRRLAWRHDPRAAAEAVRVGPLDARRLRRVLELIESRLDEPLLVEDLAQEARLGLTTFKAAFRQATGAAAHGYVIRRRAERARLLLLEGRLPASQVALEAGFTHQTHMARWLKRLFGTLPSELAVLGAEGS